jgi:alkaline phosphatase
MKHRTLIIGAAALLLLLVLTLFLIHKGPEGTVSARAKYVIIMLGDGMGAKQTEAAERYFGRPAPFAAWTHAWETTYPAGGGYDPVRAWSESGYILENQTDSAAAATALFTGIRTSNGRICVSADGTERLTSISEKARRRGLAAGAVTTTEISDATPGAWMAHNDARRNGFAIGDEGLWGEPNATGSVQDSPYYGGGHGPSHPPLDVLIGSGHPRWSQGHSVSVAMRDKLFGESGQTGAFHFIERQEGRKDAGLRLRTLARRPSVTRLAGLFGGFEGVIKSGLADGSGSDPEDPSLADMTRAALDVLGRNPSGFVLLVEGGGIDLACHDENMDRLLGEVAGFHEAVEEVVSWVDDPSNDSTWDNTLVLVLADHESGLLTAGPSVFSDKPLESVDSRTLALEKGVAGTELRASWEDGDRNDRIDSGEKVYWAWNTTGHSNSLVPLYARGPGEEWLPLFCAGQDPVRGAYMQNTDVFRLVETVLGELARPARAR